MTYYLLWFFLRLISCIPFWALYVISDGLYFLLYHVVRYRRAVVRRNLTECFPDKSLSEIRRTERGFYHFFADNIIESCKMAHMSPQQMSRRMKFTNIDQINARLRQGRSVGLYLGHYGNWEWISSMPLHLEKNATAAQIYRRQGNKTIDRLMLRLRGLMGAICVEMRQTARFATGLVASGKVAIIGFIADQSPRKRDAHHFLTFLHHRAPVLTGTEKIIRHYGFDAWFVDIRRIRRGYYEATFVQMNPDPQSLPDMELTAIYYRMLQQTIERSPELYLWSHNRFKHAELIIDDQHGN